MATAPLSRQAHTQLLNYILDISDSSNGFYASELLPKLHAIDRAYYVYKNAHPKDKDNVSAQCMAALERDSITLPMAVADTDTAVSELADTFLTGNPIFGVVAPPDQMQIIPAWEALFQYYTKAGDWSSQLFNCFSSGIRYNLPIIEVDWQLGYEFSSLDSLTTVQQQADMAPIINGVVAFHSPDPYNLIWDYRVRPSQLSSHGTHAGYNKIMTRVDLKATIAAISMDESRKKYTMNLREAYDSGFAANYYNWKPPVSQFINSDPGDLNWLEWARNEQRTQNNTGLRFKDISALYLVSKLYIKIIPSDYGISISYPNTPRIYKCIVINRQYIVYLEPIYTPANTLPIFLGDLQDDFFDYQSFSETEKQFPYQDAATELMNTRLQSAQRALGDRAIYDPHYFNEGDINTAIAAAKIPLKKSLRLEQKSIDQVYRQQPYDHASTAGIMGDIEALLGFSRMHSGRNEFQQGQNRKGNRTLGEFQTVMGNAAIRQLRIPLRIQAMVINPLQAHIKALIYQNLDKIDLINTKSRKLIAVDPTTLRQTLVDFKMTSGLIDKGKFVNPELLIAGMQTMQANPELAMAFAMPEWFAYTMTVGGIPDMEQFIREAPAQGAQPQQQLPPPQQPPPQE